MDFRKIRENENDTCPSGERLSTYSEIYKIFFEVENLLPQRTFCNFQEKMEDHSLEAHSGISFRRIVRKSF